MSIEITEAAKQDFVTVPAWALKELLGYAKPALLKECDEMGKAGHAGSEQRQNELEAVEIAEAAIVGKNTASPELVF